MYVFFCICLEVFQCCCVLHNVRAPTCVYLSHRHKEHRCLDIDDEVIDEGLLLETSGEHNQWSIHVLLKKE